MDVPEKNKSETLAPVEEPASVETSQEFFPDFATIRAALEATQIGIWFWDARTDAVTWSSNLESIHCMPPGSFDGSYACFLGTIHHGDRANVEASLKEALRTRSPYRARYRVPRRDSRDERWLEATGTVVAEGGAAKGMVGLCYDVTERVRLESEAAQPRQATGRLGQTRRTRTRRTRSLTALERCGQHGRADAVGRLRQNPGAPAWRHRAFVARRLRLENGSRRIGFDDDGGGYLRPFHVEFRRAGGRCRFRRRDAI